MPRKLSDDLSAREAAYKDFDRGGIGDEHDWFTFRAGWERAARIADERDDRIAVLEQALAAVQALLPGPRTFAETLSRDITGKPFPRLIDADAVAAALEPAGDILGRERSAGAADALEQVARHLDQPGILWYGDGGVSVEVDRKWAKTVKLTEWIRSQKPEQDGEPA